MQTAGVAAAFCWCALCTLVGLAFVSLTSGDYDTRLSSYIGFQWAHGRVPYLNIWDNRPPGIFAISAIGLSILTRDSRSLAMLEAVFILGCALVVAALLRYWRAPWSVYLLAMAAVAAGASLRALRPGLMLTETYELFPAAASMYLFARGERRGSALWVVGAGFCTGIAVLMNPVGLSPFLAQGVYLVLLALVWRRLSLGKALASLLLNAFGVALAWVPALVYFGRHRVLWGLLDASFFYNVPYAGRALGQTIFQIPVRVLERLQPVDTLCAFTLLGFLFLPQLSRGDYVLPRHTRWHWLLASLWVGFDLAGAVVGGSRGYERYFLPLVPSLAVTAAFGLWAMQSRLRRHSDRRLSYAVFLLFIVPPAFTQVADVVAIAGLAAWPQKSSADEIASQIDAVDGPGDTLFVWPYEPVVYDVTKLTSPERYLTAHYIYDSKAAYGRIGLEVMASIRQDPPTYIVDCVSRCVPVNEIGARLSLAAKQAVSRRPFLQPASEVQLNLAGSDRSAGKPSNDPIYDEFRKFVARSYIPLGQSGDLQLFRRHVLTTTE